MKWILMFLVTILSLCNSGCGNSPIGFLVGLDYLLYQNLQEQIDDLPAGMDGQDGVDGKDGVDGQDGQDIHHDSVLCEKETICHKGKTIEVCDNAVAGHLENHLETENHKADSMGACPE